MPPAELEIPESLRGLSQAQVVASSPIAMAAMCKMVVRKEVDREGIEVFEGESKPLQLWKHQWEMLHAMMRRRRVVILKARQLGITWVMAIFALWYAMTHPGSKILIVSIGEREAKAVVRRIVWLYNTLPPAVRQAFPMIRTTAEELEFGHGAGNSLISSFPATKAAGRGETVDVLLMDEGAHWEDSEQRLAALLPTAADIGQTILASTARGLGGMFFKTYQGAPANGWTAFFYDALARPDRTREWVMEERKRLGMEGTQEYPMTPDEAFVSSGRCVFDVEHLRQYLRNSIRPPDWRGELSINARRIIPEPDDYGSWKVWEWPKKKHSYLICGDPCGGNSLDFAAIVVLDLLNGNQVAAHHSKVTPELFAVNMVRAGWLWRSQVLPALVCPELNDFGRAVVTYLREWGYPNVWRQTRLDQRRDERQVEMGWLTTPATRKVAISALQEGMRQGSLGIRDADAIAEMETFVFNPKTNKEQAIEGEHDDIVMGWAITAALYEREASGVSHRDDEDETDAGSDSYFTPSDERTGY